ncbi:hypothetical protein AA313_de0204572 [Arthrobotrys entomopaga]|nr:hypothetical protein AA313_de0204572 [Arthrobotrys entomopaga]
MKISSIALALSFSATSLAAAIDSPTSLFARTGSANGCNHNNCLRAVLGDGQAGEDICKKFLWNRGYTWGSAVVYKEKCDNQLSRLVTACECVLLTNDDGPPSPSSPYITSLVRALQAADHTVSVCIPADQKSWIGKAHIIGHHPHPTFYRPDTDTTYPSPRTDGGEEWVLINGTPASCTQIGLFHLFKERGPIDLVVSGPNFGRNSSAVYALSSGTLGGSLEAALSGAKSISVSYAYRSKTNSEEIVDAASAISTRIIDHLYKHWPSDNSVHLYSLNVPLEPGIDHGRILFTHILQNTWGGCYKAVQTAEEEEDAGALEKATRDGTSSPPTTGGDGDGEALGVMDKYKFKWAPRFGDVEKAAKEPSAKGSDAWAVMQGFISITPIIANFMHGKGIGEELKL